MNHRSKADLHVHTTYSDGTASVPDVLARVAASDLQIVAITDHDTIKGALEARRLARDFGVDVIVGEEVSTREGHLVALYIEDELPPQRPASETIAAVHAQGGLCIAAHPYDWATSSLGYSYRQAHRRFLSADHPWQAWQVDAIEVLNASLVWPRARCNALALRDSQLLNMPAIGGSDAHSSATIGCGYTVFPGRTADDLYRAIVRNTVGWGGSCWNAGQLLEMTWLSVRCRSLRGALRWAFADLIPTSSAAPIGSESIDTAC